MRTNPDDEGHAWPDSLDPKLASQYLKEKWSIRASVGTLANWRCNGIADDDPGPPFQKDGARINYPRAGLDEFAATRLSKLVRSTSELREQAAA